MWGDTGRYPPNFKMLWTHSVSIHYRDFFSALDPPLAPARYLLVHFPAGTTPPRRHAASHASPEAGTPGTRARLRDPDLLRGIS